MMPMSAPLVMPLLDEVEVAGKGAAVGLTTNDDVMAGILLFINLTEKVPPETKDCKAVTVSVPTTSMVTTMLPDVMDSTRK